MRTTILIFFTIANFALGNIEEPPLPEWNDETRSENMSDDTFPGSILLSFEDEDAPPNLPFPPAPDLIEETSTAFIPDEDLVADEDLPAYFANRPKSYLVDPQNLLSPLQSTDLTSTLETHSNDSTIDIYLYIFNTGQHIPGDVRDEETVERLYASGKPAIVVFYYLAEPQRATLYLSPSLTDHISAAEQRRGLNNSILQALDNPEPFNQLQAFSDQISLRAYWMERIIEDHPSPTTPSPPETTPIETETPSTFKYPQISPEVRQILLISSLAVLLFLGTFIALKIKNIRRKFFFPPNKTEPRLGAEHAAGVGAVISFTKDSLPPAKQRESPPTTFRKR